MKCQQVVIGFDMERRRHAWARAVRAKGDRRIWYS